MLGITHFHARGSVRFWLLLLPKQNALGRQANPWQDCGWTLFGVRKTLFVFVFGSERVRIWSERVFGTCSSTARPFGCVFVFAKCCSTTRPARRGSPCRGASASARRPSWLPVLKAHGIRASRRRPRRRSLAACEARVVPEPAPYMTPQNQRASSHWDLCAQSRPCLRPIASRTRLAAEAALEQPRSWRPSLRASSRTLTAAAREASPPPSPPRK